MVGTVKQKLFVKAVPNGLTMMVITLNLLPPDPKEQWRADLYDKSEIRRHAPFVINPNVNKGYIGKVKMYGVHSFPVNSLGAHLEIVWELKSNSTLHRDAALSAEDEVKSTTATEEAGYPAADPNNPASGKHPVVEVAKQSTLESSHVAAFDTVDPNDPASWPTKLDAIGALPEVDEGAGNSRCGAQIHRGCFIVETTKWGAITRPDYASVVYQIGDATPLWAVSGIPGPIIGMPDDALFIIGAM
ncbi:hypothetical protein CCMSSC00406_0007960 [Pleurotus cornucopiae]|uniref:Uncharacterized protein n=1 Tax=Pleurotus cornucopiae TaxID=5321 RepID=A0ACB7IL62_PLECO|nr:hypothetical protein CCMSSC00406_0007960 [Pleurotus cornucopiae]